MSTLCNACAPISASHVVSTIIGRICCGGGTSATGRNVAQSRGHRVSTVQEKVGLRGTNTNAYDLDPRIYLAADVGHATDYPDREVDLIVRRVMGRN